MPTIKEIKDYYDEHTIGKLRGFVYVNERVERAWETFTKQGGNRPKTILEIGCGIGDICWRMSNHWSGSEITGLDISPKSIEIATKLFSTSNTSFIEKVFDKDSFSIKFDLIVLMDVYEHIALADRASLHEGIKHSISENGRVVLAFPTPRHLEWLRTNMPEYIQPVDEDVTIDTISQLAKDIGKEVLLYKEVSVWHAGDYAHAVLGSRIGWPEESDREFVKSTPIPSIKRLVKNKIRRKLSKNKPVANLIQSQVDIKLKMIEEKLGAELASKVKITS